MKAPDSLANLENLAVSSLAFSAPLVGPLGYRFCFWFVSVLFFLLCFTPTEVCANVIADLPAAKDLLNWLRELPQSRDRKNPQFELFQSLQSALESPSDGRHRFVLPCSLSKAKRESLVFKQAFSSEAERSEFETLIERLLGEIRDKAKAADVSNQPEQSLQLKWMEAGFNSFTSRMKSDSWLPAEAIQNPKRPSPAQNPNHPITGWRGSTFEWIRTPHFDIASRGTKADAAMMAELCEQVYAVWQQIFFPYWASGINPLQGESKPTPPPFQVVLFSNKREYEETLRRQVPNVELSTGYYNQNSRHSFFYFDQSKSYATLVHELTHQFFAEAVSTNLEFDPDVSPGFWVAEGIAIYMESLSIRELGPSILVDVGGWDAPRLQSARFHFLRNETWLPIEKFGQLSGAEFRKPEGIALRYSFAGGLAHRWMDSGSSSKASLIQHLRYLYFQDVDSYLQPWDDKDLPSVYAEFMQSGPKNTRDYLPYINRPDLVLSRCEFNSELLTQLLARRSKWNWVDLSFNEIDDRAFIDEAYKLDVVRLSLENTKVTDQCLEAILKMPRLEELDLSNCAITDDGLKAIAGNRTIRTLWLSGTDVTNETLRLLESCPRLEAIHVDRTQVTHESWERLMKAKPRLRSASTAP